MKINMIVALFSLGLVGWSCESRTSPMGSTQPDGELSINIRLGKLAQATISRAEVVVSGSGMSEMRSNLRVSGSSLTGTVSGIPAGTNRLFVLNAYDASNSLIYTGSGSANVVAGQEVTVRITMRSVSAAADASVVELQGVPSVQAGLHSDRNDSWSSFPTVGNDARIVGEVKNTNSTTITGVTIDVTVRDLSGNFIGRAAQLRIDKIENGRSGFFEVFVDNAFPEGGKTSVILEIDITYQESNRSVIWICTDSECNIGS